MVHLAVLFVDALLGGIHGAFHPGGGQRRQITGNLPFRPAENKRRHHLVHHLPESTVILLFQRLHPFVQKSLLSAQNAGVEKLELRPEIHGRILHRCAG